MASAAGASVHHAGTGASVGRDGHTDDVESCGEHAVYLECYGMRCGQQTAQGAAAASSSLVTSLQLPACAALAYALKTCHGRVLAIGARLVPAQVFKSEHDIQVWGRAVAVPVRTANTGRSLFDSHVTRVQLALV